MIENKFKVCKRCKKNFKDPVAYTYPLSDFITQYKPFKFSTQTKQRVHNNCSRCRKEISDNAKKILKDIERRLLNKSMPIEKMAKFYYYCGIWFASAINNRKNKNKTKEAMCWKEYHKNKKCAESLKLKFIEKIPLTQQLGIIEDFEHLTEENNVSDKNV